MFQAIADFLNAIFAALQNIANIGKIASNPLGGLFGGSEDTPESEPTKPSPSIPSPAKRKLVTIPEVINARFDDTGSPAWKNQPGGKHLGTDFGGPNGTPVFNPWSMNVVKVGYYDDEGRRGAYIIGTLADGTEYYTGHLANVKVKPGDYIEAGTHIADIGFYNHTHIQLRVAGALTDFEVYEKL